MGTGYSIRVTGYWPRNLPLLVISFGNFPAPGCLQRIGLYRTSTTTTRALAISIASSLSEVLWTTTRD